MRVRHSQIREELMRRLILLCTALLVLAGTPWTARAQTLLFDYVGFDYEDPNPNAGTFGEPGSGYFGLGFVPGLFAPLAADTTTNQYTYVMSGMTPVGSQSFPPYLLINYSAGQLSIYEDSKTTGTDADYGANPPNASAPVDFVDGTLFLQGTLTGFQFILNTSNGTGSFEAVFNATGGSQLTNFGGQTSGWTFAGSSGNALNIPPGYAHQIDGQTFLSKPTVSRHVTWGALKSIYR